jgi:predicted hydrocarbon binding protein
MANKAQRVLESIRLSCPDSVYRRVCEDFSELSDTLTTAAQRRIVKELLTRLEAECGSDACARVMRPCGYNCLAASTISEGRKKWALAAGDLPTFLLALNESGIGGGNMHMENGSIIAVYSKCYCGLAKNGGLPAAYCECSAGWFEKFFSEVFGSPVLVRLRRTILSGADECVFQIDIT